MRGKDQSTAYRAFGAAHGQFRWPQAGLKSSAYRLAHLSLPKSVAISLLAAVFFIV